MMNHSINLMKKAPCILLLVASIFLSGCGNIMKDKSEALKKIPEFHSLYNEQNFAKIYTDSDSEFKTAASQAKLEEFLSAVFRKLGKNTGSTTQNWSINHYNTKTYVVLLEDSTFEQGKGVEKFTYIMRNGVPVLQAYHIESPDLILK